MEPFLASQGLQSPQTSVPVSLILGLAVRVQHPQARICTSCSVAQLHGCAPKHLLPLFSHPVLLPILSASFSLTFTSPTVTSLTVTSLRFDSSGSPGSSAASSSSCLACGSSPILLRALPAPPTWAAPTALLPAWLCTLSVAWQLLPLGSPRPALPPDRRPCRHRLRDRPLARPSSPRQVLCGGDLGRLLLLHCARQGGLWLQAPLHAGRGRRAGHKVVPQACRGASQSGG